MVSLSGYRMAIPATPFPLEGIDQRTRWEQFLDYIIIGFEHIVPKGLDHILFVIGIFC